MKFSPKLLARARTSGGMRLLNAFPEWHAARRKLSGPSSEITNIVLGEIAEHWQEPIDDLSIDRSPQTIRTTDLDLIYTLQLPPRQASQLVTEEESANILKNSSFDLYGSLQGTALNWSVGAQDSEGDSIDPWEYELLAFDDDGFVGARCIHFQTEDNTAFMFQSTEVYVPAKLKHYLACWCKGTGTVTMWITGRSLESGNMINSSTVASEVDNNSWNRIGGHITLAEPLRDPIFYISVQGDLYIDACTFVSSNDSVSWQPAYDDVPHYMLTENRRNKDLWFLYQGKRLPIYYAGNFLDFFGLAVPTRVRIFHEEDVKYEGLPVSIGGKYDFWGKWWDASFRIDAGKICKFNTDVPTETWGEYELWDLKDDGEYAAIEDTEPLAICPLRDFLAVLCRETKSNGEEIISVKVVNPEFTEPEKSAILVIHTLEINDLDGLLETEAETMYLLPYNGDPDRLVLRGDYDGYRLHHTLQFAYDYYWLDPENVYSASFRENYNPYGGVLFA